jgi:hypothetical protein
MRRSGLSVALGLVLLVLALAAGFLARGVGQATSAFRHAQADWQRGLIETPADSPGPAQRAGEAVLGISARSDVLRAYQNYRAGLADVIPGTVYPQTRARFEAVKELRRLRPSLGPHDRASADVVLGVIYAASADDSGEQRSVQARHAIDLFRRAVVEDPENATAKLDLEVMLRAELNRARTRSSVTSSGSPSRRGRPQNPRGRTAPARPEGTGY